MSEACSFCIAHLVVSGREGTVIYNQHGRNVGETYVSCVMCSHTLGLSHSQRQVQDMVLWVGASLSLV